MGERAALPVRPELPKPGREEVIPEALPALEALLAVIEREIDLWNDYICRLSELEDPGQGVFYAKELHEARQYRMVLRYKLDFCRARLKRLNS